MGKKDPSCGLQRGAEVVFDGSGMMFSEAIEVTALDGRMPVIAAPPDGKASFNLRSWLLVSNQANSKPNPPG